MSAIGRKPTVRLPYRIDPAPRRNEEPEGSDLDAFGQR